MLQTPFSTRNVTRDGCVLDDDFDIKMNYLTTGGPQHVFSNTNEVALQNFFIKVVLVCLCYGSVFSFVCFFVWFVFS